MSEAEKLPFRPGKLAMRGHFLVRATVRQSIDQDRFGWHLTLLTPEGQDDPYLLFADLHKVQDGWLVGATIGAPIDLPPRVKRTAVPYEALKIAVSQLFKATLWDTTAMVVRQLAAMAPIEGFVLDLVPPESDVHLEGEFPNHAELAESSSS